MSLPQSPKHVVFPVAIQTHLPGGAAPAENPHEEFELSLKVAAMLSRGVVISDSDLNNNPVLHGQLTESSAFKSAIEIGFVRRAVRAADGGGPTSQAKVAEALLGSSPERFARIPPGHVAALDIALTAAEEAGFPPLLWTFGDLGDLFARRLVTLMDTGRLACLDAHGRAQVNRRVEHTLFARGLEWVVERSRSGKPIAAAAFENDLRPAGPTPEEQAAWQVVFDRVLEAYNGNIPTALRLSLADRVVAPVPFLPAGPESVDEETTTELALYEMDSEQARSTFKVVQRTVPIPDVLQDIIFDSDRLRDIDIRDIVAAREQAAPDAFFDIRHRSLGSGALLEESLPKFFERAAEYVERFAAVGKRMTMAATSRAVREKLRQRDGIQTYHLTSRDEDFLVEQMMCFISNKPWIGSQVAVCDLEILRRYRPDFDRIAGHLVDRSSLCVQRPDYRIIERVSDRLLRG